MRQRFVRGPDVTGTWQPSGFGFGFCDVISSKETHILLMRTKHIYVLIHVRRKGEVGTVQHD